jgi:polar amino acid transport system substrate-binding protein
MPVRHLHQLLRISTHPWRRKGASSRLLGLLLLALALSANANVNAEGPVLRACSLPLPPQTMLDKQGQPDGYAVKILQAVAQRLHWQLHIDYMPWMRVVADAQQGKCDLMLTVLRRDDYESYMVFPQTPILDQTNVLVVRRKQGIVYNGDLEAFMRQHSVGLYRDKALDNDFERLRRADWARVDLANTPAQNIEKLLAGRFDAAIENDLTAVHVLRGLGRLQEAQLLRPPLNVTPAYVTFPHAGKATDKVAAFDKALLAFKRTAEFRQLQAIYLGQ